MAQVDYNPLVENRKYPAVIKVTLTAVLFGFVLFLAFLVASGPVAVYAQHPTVSMATVTGTPAGAIAVVYQDLVQVNVRAGPGQNYPEIGVLVKFQEVPALGVSQGGDYVQIVYMGVPGGVGWVHANFVEVSHPLPVVESPPTPTPRMTPTLNPTLAAQYAVDVAPTPLPTFTSAPPLIVPTLAADEPFVLASGNLPMGFIIVGLAVVGLFGTMLSFLRGR